MDMNMDIGTASGSLSHHDHHEAHDSNTNTMEMPMSSTFRASTTITLFFSSWTTTSPFTYTATLIFLFLLAFLNRFLTALRFQLESADARSTEYSTSIPILEPPKSRRRGLGVRIPKARLSPLPVYMRVENDRDKDRDCEEAIDSEEEVRLALHVPSLGENEEEEKSGSGARTTRIPAWSRIQGFFPSVIPTWKWKESAPWSPRQDGSRAMLEGVRAFMGYILMLAVMTFNVGVFIAVLAGIVFGELVLGRFMRHSAWEDGACHD
ncbi:Ctr copper transporter [Aspergillus pseudodeflectus]|uniref:Copper transport protein n=1 Tax=Aspergillus pseudodeflectus TaxID=176178 RepID=A0ABR4L4P6_9EURO